MKKYAIIGFPLGHSASPRIHNTAFEYYRLKAHYEKLEIPPERFDTEIRKIKGDDWAGFNVTIPHKQRITAFLDKIDPPAQRIGAVNTIKVDEDGRWLGYNTDYHGFLKPLGSYRQVIRRALLIGAGGAARAVAFALCDLPNMEHLCLLNRSPQKSRELKDDLQNYKPLDYRTAETDEDLSHKPYDILVNATPVGMGDLKSELPLNPTLLSHEETIVYDLIYNPRETLFLERAKAAGLTVINGWPMLLGQAEAAFSIWTGRSFTQKLVERLEHLL